MRKLLKEVLTQWKCLLLGHDGPAVKAGWDWFVRCDRCGRRSPGLRIDGPSPRQTQLANGAHLRDLGCHPVVGNFPKYPAGRVVPFPIVYGTVDDVVAAIAEPPPIPFRASTITRDLGNQH